MANTQELMLRIRGDNTDAERKLSQTGKSVEGFEVSTRKASSAMKVFGKDLLNVRDTSDLVSAATRALGSVIAGSLGGTAVIVAGKALIDAYRSVQDSAKEAEKSISAVQKTAGKIGAGEGLQSTAGAAKALFSEAEKVSEKLKEIESNPLKNFIGGITGATEKMQLLVAETDKQAKALERQGVVNTLIDTERTSNLSDTDKAIRAIGEKYQPIIEAARATGDAELLNTAILQAQAEQVEVLRKAKDAEAAEEKKRADARAKADSNKETENELYDIQRQRNLERTRAELQQQVRLNEEKLKQEKQLAEEAELQAQFKRSGSVFSGKGGQTKFGLRGRDMDTTSLFERNAGILGASREGRQSLDVARRQRQRRVSREDFQFQRNELGEEAKRLSEAEGRTVTRQDVRNRMARQIAKSELPSLEEKSGSDLQNSLQRLVSLMESAPLVTSGSGSR